MIFIKHNIFIFLFFVLLIFCGQIKNISSLPNLNISKQDSALNLNTNFVKIVSLGQTRLISDVLWILTLLESDHDHYKKNDLNSWLYLRFNTIASIDPYFLRNYQFGGQYLSIIKDDLAGAEKIFIKGLSYYPKDYKLNFNLGFLYAIEKEDYKSSIPYFNNIKDSKEAPKNIKSLLIKVRHMSHEDLELSFKITEELLNTTKSKYLEAKLKADLYSIRAELDLKCLNETKPNCNTLDYDGNKYFFDGKKFLSFKKYKKYRLFKRNKAH